MRSIIHSLVSSITPLDALEAEHRSTTLEWIDSGAPLFRVVKPATPPMHLVSYFALVDPERERLLLVDHINAGLWLPSGGHVEPDEDPRDTVCREITEELGVEAAFLLDDPLFLTVTSTVGSTAGHTDVSLWFVVRGDAERDLSFDRGEFHSVAWFAFDRLPLDRCDPHLERFVSKLRGGHAVGWNNDQREVSDGSA